MRGKTETPLQLIVHHGLLRVCKIPAAHHHCYRSKVMSGARFPSSSVPVYVWLISAPFASWPSAASTASTLATTTTVIASTGG